MAKDTIVLASHGDREHSQTLAKPRLLSRDPCPVISQLKAAPRSCPNCSSNTEWISIPRCICNFFEAGTHEHFCFGELCCGFPLNRQYECSIWYFDILLFYFCSPRMSSLSFIKYCLFCAVSELIFTFKSFQSDPFISERIYPFLHLWGPPSDVVWCCVTWVETTWCGTFWCKGENPKPHFLVFERQALGVPFAFWFLIYDW